jgi:hypothetical protein
MGDGQGTHPTVEEIGRYSRFECDEEEWEPLATHLTECDECGIILFMLATEGRQRGAGNERAE